MLARVAIVPDAVSTLESTKSSVPLPIGVGSPSLVSVTAPCCGLASALCSSAKIAFRQIEVDLQRVHLGDRHQRGRRAAVAVADGDEVAHGDADGAQPAGNRRGDGGKAKLDIVGVDRRLVGIDGRRRRLLRGNGLIIGLLRAGLLGDQVLGALKIGTRAGQHRLVLGERRLVLGELRLQRAVIEREQGVAGLHHLAVLDVDRDDLTGHPRIDVDHCRRGDEADGVAPDREIGRRCRRRKIEAERAPLPPAACLSPAACLVTSRFVRRRDLLHADELLSLAQRVGER